LNASDVFLEEEKRNGRVFAAPWHAQVFSMCVNLSEAGYFTWSEWVERFVQEPGEEVDAYYERWLAALEKIVADRRLVTPAELGATQDAWREAARKTPHGQPIVIS
jgi:nitrile hydratase accessory protein